MKRKGWNGMRIASFDIETTNLRANFGVVICGAVQPHTGRREAIKVYRQEVVSSDDSAVVNDLITELNTYTILIAHNGVGFDRKFLNTRAVKHGLPVLSPRLKMYDPVRVARRELLMSWNGLDALAQYLGCRHQKYGTVGELWIKAALDHDPAALEEIVKHCVADVKVLDEVADRLEPLIGRVNEWGS